MQFTAPIFFLFLLVFFALWPITAKRNELRWGYLVLASFVFYGWANWLGVLVLGEIGIISYISAIGIGKFPRHKRLWLSLGLVGTIGFLLVIRYFPWFADVVNKTFNTPGLPARTILPPLEFIQFNPLGIGFYTLQAVSYLLDVNSGQIQAVRNPLHYFAYLSLFPKLISGPIERGGNLLPQLMVSRVPNEQERWDSFKLIVSGYFLKNVIADNLAPVVNAAFSAPVFNPSSLYWWSIITVFAFQLYCDFAGYTRIALGLAGWMGYRLTNNFNNPYLSTSVGDFWTRWHISLSAWLRDYVFFPLSRSRLGKRHLHLNLWITMLVSGLWHGAAWTYVVWGGLHGLYISLERWTRWPNRVKQVPGGRGIAWILTILQLWPAWVVFRAESLLQAGHILLIMFSFSGTPLLPLDFNAAVFLGIAVLWELSHLVPFRLDLLNSSSWGRAFEIAVYTSILVAAVYFRGPGSEFVYFQF